MSPCRRVGSFVAIAALVGGCGGANRNPTRHAPATTVAVPAPQQPVVVPPTGTAVSELSAPATGPAKTGTGYTLRLARGWQEITGDRKLEGADYELAVADSAHHTVTVARHQAPFVRDAGLLAGIARADAKLSNPTSSSAPEPVVLDGVQGYRIGYRFRVGGERAGVRLVVALRDGFVYQIRLLTTLADLTPSVGAFDAMVSSWRWAG